MKPRSSSTSAPTQQSKSKSKKHTPTGTQTTLLSHLKKKETPLTSNSASSRLTSRPARKSDPSEARPTPSSLKKRARASEPALTHSTRKQARDSSDEDDDDDDELELGGNGRYHDGKIIGNKGKEREVHQFQLGQRSEQDIRNSSSRKGKEKELERDDEFRGNKKQKLSSNSNNSTASGSKGQIATSTTSLPTSASTLRRDNVSRPTTKPQQRSSFTEDSVTEDESFSPDRRPFVRRGAQHSPIKGQFQDQTQLQSDQELSPEPSHSQSQQSLLPWQEKMRARMPEFRKYNGLPPREEDLPPSREEQLEEEREKARIAREKSMRRFQGIDTRNREGQGSRNQVQNFSPEKEKMEVEYDHDDTLTELNIEAEYLQQGPGFPTVDNNHSRWDEDESLEMGLARAREAEEEELLKLTSTRDKGKRRENNNPALLEGKIGKLQDNVPLSDPRIGNKRKRKTQNTPPQSPLKDRLLSLSKRRETARTLAPDTPSQPKRMQTGFHPPSPLNVSPPRGGFRLDPGVIDLNQSYHGGGFSINNAPNPEESIIVPRNQDLEEMAEQLLGTNQNDGSNTNHVRFSSTSTSKQAGPSGTSGSKKSGRSRSRSRSKSKSRGTPRGEDEDSQEYARREIQRHLKTLLKKNDHLHSPVSGQVIYHVETQPPESESSDSEDSETDDEMEDQDEEEEEEIAGSDRGRRALKVNPEILDSPSARREKRRDPTAASRIGTSPLSRSPIRSPLHQSTSFRDSAPLASPSIPRHQSQDRNHSFTPPSPMAAPVHRTSASIEAESQLQLLRSNEKLRREDRGADAPNTSQTEAEPTPAWIKENRNQAEAQEEEEDGLDQDQNQEMEHEDDETQPLPYESEEEEEVLRPGPQSDSQSQIPSQDTLDMKVRTQVSPQSRLGARSRFSLPPQPAPSQIKTAPRNTSALDSWNQVQDAWKGHLDPVEPDKGSSSKARTSNQASVPQKEQLKQSTLGSFGFTLPTKKAGPNLSRNGPVERIPVPSSQSLAPFSQHVERQLVPSSQSLAPFSLLGRDLEDELSDEEFGYGDQPIINQPRNGAGFRISNRFENGFGGSRGKKDEVKIPTPARAGSGGASSGSRSRTLTRQESEPEIVYESEGAREDDGGSSSETQALPWDEQEEDDKRSSPIRPRQGPAQAEKALPALSSRPQMQQRYTDTTDSSDLTPLEELEMDNETQLLAWSGSEAEEEKEKEVEKEEESQESELEETQRLPDDYDDESEEEETQALDSSQSQGFNLEEGLPFIPTPATMTRASAKRLEQSGSNKNASKSSNSSPTKKSKNRARNEAQKSRNLGNLPSSSSPPSPASRLRSSPSPQSSSSRSSPIPRPTQPPPTQTKSGKPFYPSRRDKARHASSDLSGGSSQSDIIDSSLPSLNGNLPKSYANIRKRLG